MIAYRASPHPVHNAEPVAFDGKPFPAAPDTYLSLWRGAIPIPSRHHKTMRDVAVEIADRYAISLEDLLGDSQERTFAWPRQHLMWTLDQIRWFNGRKRHSRAAIGRFLGRDHTTVIHGCRAHERRMTADWGE